MSNQLKHPVIISGGGLVGLTLAQYLERIGIPYLLFERDESPDARYGGWGISINWVTPALQKCLTPEAFDAIKALHNDPRTLEEDTIPYRYFDLENGKAKTTHFLPPQLRVSRLKLREILARGVKINWGTSVTGWEEVDDGVIVSLSDGKTVKGSILAGADGKNSNIKRKILGEEKAKLYTFPMGFVGLKMRLAPEKIAPFRDLSRIFFHGTHPNGKFIFFSTISTPEVNGSKGTENEYFEAQLNMSWNAGDATQDILNLPPAEKLKELKKAATEGTGFFKELREGFNNIPDDTEVLDIVLQDWMTESWQPLASVTILGDAVHPMTMYRGEAANHGMFDAYMLGCQLHKVSMGEKDMAKAIEDFEREMVSRAQEAVSLSRTAGFEVHDLDAISESSALFQYPHLQRLEALMSQ